jgi:hypothetical protein
VRNEGDDSVEPRIGRCELPETGMHVDVHLIVHCWVIADLDEAAATEVTLGFQHGIPGCGYADARSAHCSISWSSASGMASFTIAIVAQERMLSGADE